MINAVNTQSPLPEDLQREFALLMGRTHRLGADLAREVEEAYTLGESQPLTVEEAVTLLTTVIEALRSGAAQRSDQHLVEALQGDIHNLVQRLVESKSQNGYTANTGRVFKKIFLDGFNGAQIAPVRSNTVLSREGNSHDVGICSHEGHQSLGAK